MPNDFFCPNREVHSILNSEGIICVVGSGRSGKTALAHLIASSSSKPVYALNYPQSVIDAYCPDGWYTINQKDVFNLTDCVLLVDDAALWADNRSYNSKWSKAWVKFQTIISHKGITVIFVIQSMNLIDIGVLRSQRMCILYKYSNLTNVAYERKEFQRIASFARQSISLARKNNPSFHPKSWVFDSDLGKVWGHRLPSYWDKRLSVPYRDYLIEVIDDGN